MAQIRTTSVPDTQGKYSESSWNGSKSPNNDAGGFIIPPSKVLWAWLSYVFEQTGEWLMPPGYSPKDAGASNSTCSDQKDISRVYTPPSDGGNPELEPTEKGTLAYQMPFPTMLPYAPVAKSGTNEDIVPSSSKGFAHPTGFNYVNSVYRQFAELLLDKYARRQVKAELLAGCKAALCLIVAWCNHGLFRTMGNRSGQWMTLGFERCARELQMRASHFKSCLVELEEVGLIITGQISGSIISSDELARLRYDLTQLNKTESFWSSRSLQRTTTVYRLNVGVAELQQLENLVLPIFEPDALPNETAPTGKDRAGLGKCTERSGQDLNLKSEQISNQKGGRDISRKSVPVLPLYGIHDNDYDDDEKGNENKLQKEISDKRNDSIDYVNPHPLPLQQPNAAFEETPPTRLERLLAVMTPEQQAKFHFLNDQAVFTGFTVRGGRTTLDSREALKFAANEELSLEEVKLRYSQTKEMWVAGRCHTSPLGLLHWALTQNCDPRSTDEQSAHALFLDQNKRNAQSKKQGNISSSTMKPTEAAGQKAEISAYSKPSFPTGKRTNFKREQGANNPVKNSLGVLSSYEQGKIQTTFTDYQTFTTNGVTDLAPLPQNLAQVWQEVLEDLEGRWKLSGKDLALLRGSQLLLEEQPSISQAEGSPSRQATVVLKSVVEERLLNLAGRSTIQLCLRQKLGFGYTYVFTAQSTFP